MLPALIVFAQPLYPRRTLEQLPPNGTYGIVPEVEIDGYGWTFDANILVPQADMETTLHPVFERRLKTLLQEPLRTIWDDDGATRLEDTMVQIVFSENDVRKPIACIVLLPQVEDVLPEHSTEQAQRVEILVSNALNTLITPLPTRNNDGLPDGGNVSKWMASHIDFNDRVPESVLSMLREVTLGLKLERELPSHKTTNRTTRL